MPVNFKFNEGSENLSSHSGLALVGALLERTDLNVRLSNVELIDCKEPVISHSDIVYSMVGLQCIGKPDYLLPWQFHSQAKPVNFVEFIF